MERAFECWSWCPPDAREGNAVHRLHRAVGTRSVASGAESGFVTGWPQWEGCPRDEGGEPTMTTHTTTETHRKTASCFVRGVEVTVWCFTKYHVVSEPDGTECYVPRSRDATLIKLPGGRTLWLN